MDHVTRAQELGNIDDHKYANLACNFVDFILGYLVLFAWLRVGRLWQHHSVVLARSWSDGIDFAGSSCFGPHGVLNLPANKSWPLGPALPGHLRCFCTILTFPYNECVT